MFKRLGDAKNETVVDPEANTDNSQSKKTRKGDFGALFMEVPRDRRSCFGSERITKHRTGWSCFGQQIRLQAGTVQG